MYRRLPTFSPATALAVAFALATTALGGLGAPKYVWLVTLLFAIWFALVAVAGTEHAQRFMPSLGRLPMVPVHGVPNAFPDLTVLINGHSQADGPSPIEGREDRYWVQFRPLITNHSSHSVALAFQLALSSDGEALAIGPAHTPLGPRDVTEPLALPAEASVHHHLNFDLPISTANRFRRRVRMGGHPFPSRMIPQRWMRLRVRDHVSDSEFDFPFGKTRSGKR